MADDELVEVFRTADQMAAQAAIDEVLEPAGVEAVLLDRTNHQLPTPTSGAGSYFVAVPADEVDAATTALREALEDGAIDGELAVESP